MTPPGNLDSFLSPDPIDPGCGETLRHLDVYVDLPTAFAYIKLPTGWKFIGKLDASQLKQLPPGTLTALLKTDAEATPTRMAAAEQAAPAPVLK